MKSMGFERILLATDGTRQAEGAANAAASLALASCGSVRVVHVWSLEVHHREGMWDIETHQEAEQLIGQSVDRLRALGVGASGLISRSDRSHVAAAIAEAARDYEADLVVVGSRGLSDWQSLFQHSVSHQLLGAVDCPVLIVRGAETPTVHRAQKVLVAIAGGDDLEPALRAAVAAASAPGSKVVLLHVAQAIIGAQGFSYVETDDEIRATVERATEILEDAGVPSEAIVAEPGAVAGIVAETAAAVEADMIVLGSSRMGDIASILFGSVTHRLLKTATKPVLVAERSHR